MIDDILEKLDTTEKLRLAREDFKKFIEEQVTSLEAIAKRLSDTRRGLSETTEELIRIRREVLDQMLNVDGIPPVLPN